MGVPLPAELQYGGSRVELYRYEWNKMCIYRCFWILLFCSVLAYHIYTASSAFQSFLYYGVIVYHNYVDFLPPGCTCLKNLPSYTWSSCYHVELFETSYVNCKAIYVRIWCMWALEGYVFYLASWESFPKWLIPFWMHVDNTKGEKLIYWRYIVASHLLSC